MNVIVSHLIKYVIEGSVSADWLPWPNILTPPTENNSSSPPNWELPSEREGGGRGRGEREEEGGGEEEREKEGKRRREKRRGGRREEEGERKRRREEEKGRGEGGRRRREEEEGGRGEEGKRNEERRKKITIMTYMYTHTHVPSTDKCIPIVLSHNCFSCTVNSFNMRLSGYSDELSV